MNVLIITTDFNYSSGVTRHVLNLLIDLSENANCKLFFMCNGGDAFKQLNNINLADTFKFKYKHGVSKFIYFIPNLIYLFKLVKKHKIDIIHTHHRYPELLASFIKNQKIKKITTLHSKVRKWKYISLKSDVLIAVSQSIKNHVIEYYATDADKVIVMYNYVNIHRNNHSSDLSLSDSFTVDSKEYSTILFVGRVSYVKGVDILIKAANELKKYRKIKLLLVGQVDKDFKSELLNIDAASVMVIPPTTNIMNFYTLADVIVLPSREDPFPYVMLEAGTSEKPFIGSAVDGIAEFIDDGENGILFASEDYKNLEQKIELVLNNKTLAHQLSIRLNEKVNNECRKDLYLEKLIQIYERD